jgi:hypothetical protein
LVLTEAVVDELLAAIEHVDENEVHPKGRNTLKRLKASASFGTSLARGIPLPEATRKKFAKIRVEAAANATGAVGKKVVETVGLWSRNPEDLNVTDKDDGPIVLVLRDLEPISAVPYAPAKAADPENATAPDGEVTA